MISRWFFFLCSILLLSSIVSAFVVDFGRSEPIFYDRTSDFNFSYSCVPLQDAPYLKGGDFVEFFVSSCFGTNCKLLDTGVFVYGGSQCSASKNYVVFVPFSAFRDGLSFVFVAHRLDDPVVGDFPISFVKRFQVVRPIEVSPIVPLITQPVGLGFLNLYFFIGLILVLLSIFLIRYGFLWALLLLFLGLGLMAFGFFFVK